MFTITRRGTRRRERCGAGGPPEGGRVRSGDRGGRRHRLRPRLHLFKTASGTSRCRQKYTSDLLSTPASRPCCRWGTSSTTAAARRVCPVLRPEMGAGEGDHPPRGRQPRVPHHRRHRLHRGERRRLLRLLRRGGRRPGKGYYSYDIGAWHLIALNTNCSFVGCGSLAAGAVAARRTSPPNPRPARSPTGITRCSARANHGSTSVTALFQALYDAGADVVLVGHDHDYERFAPQNPTGGGDPARGIRQFVVGTGGGSLAGSARHANSEVRNSDTFGVLKLTLHPGELRLAVRAGGRQGFRDAGSQMCH